MHLLRNCQYLQSWPNIIYVDEAVRSEREQRNRRLQQRRRGSIRILFSASEVVPNRGRMANLNQAIHGGLGGRGQPTDWSLVWVEVRAPAEVTHAGRGSLILEARLQASNLIISAFMLHPATVASS